MYHSGLYAPDDDIWLHHGVIKPKLLLAVSAANLEHIASVL